MNQFRQFLLLIFALLLGACGDPSVEEPAAPAQSVDVETSNDPEADAITESVTDIIGGSSDDSLDSESDEAMATVEAMADQIEAEGQNDANTGTDAGDDRDTPTLIEPGNYSGTATFGVDDLSLDMRDVYRVSANAGDYVNVTVTNAQTVGSTTFDVYTHNDYRVYVDGLEPGDVKAAELVMASGGYVDIVLSAESYNFSVAVERANDAGVDGDAANDPSNSSPMPPTQASAALGVPSDDGTPDRDCYAHAGAEVTFYAPDGQRFRPTISATTFDANGNQINTVEAFYGGSDPFIVAADAAATAVCFTASLNGDADLLHALYVFSPGVAADSAAIADSMDSFDGCSALPAETVKATFGVIDDPEIEMDDLGICNYSFNDSFIFLTFSEGLEGDIEFYRNAGGEKVEGLGSDASMINTQGQNILIWMADDGVTYQLAGLDLNAGEISAEILMQLAQAVNN